MPKMKHSTEPGRQSAKKAQKKEPRSQSKFTPRKWDGNQGSPGGSKSGGVKMVTPRTRGSLMKAVD